MRPVLVKAWVVCLLVALVPATAFAQASITGVVTDSSGGVLPGVTVEAASPAIIEKVRTAVTDGTGQYRITELRPGAYTVTFTLPGFATVVRDGITLTGAFTAAVNAEMRVGALSETITVSGEAPIVDVQSSTRQRVMDEEVISTLPTGRNMFNLGVLIPGVTISTGGLVAQDVGGSLGPETRALVVHGGRTEDQRFMMNGVSLSSMIGGGWGGGAIPNATGVTEMVFDTASVSADLATGGVRINFIAREGGNQFHGTLAGAFANSSMQTSNIGSDLLALNPNLVNAGGIDKNWDFNPGVGGPIARDKLWFFFSGRYQGANLFVPGMFYDKNASNPNVWNYEADLSRPAKLEKTWYDAQLRMSWQATPRNKIGLTYQNQIFCACHDNITSTRAPEAGRDRRFPVQRPVLVDWTAPVTNKLLLEASGIHRVERWGNMHLQEKDLLINPAIVGVQEQGGSIPNLIYRSNTGTYNNSWNENFHWRFNVSYVTGSHAFKVGANDAYGHYENLTYATNPMSYRFRDGVPNRITIQALPDVQANSVNHDFGLFAQDKWTLNRMTLSVGLRFDHFASGFPVQELGPTPFTPTRNLSFPASDNLSYNDITPKSQLAFDVFGDGKTALKVSFNKYLQGLGTTGTLTSGPNPIARITRSVNRNWIDGNTNYVPDCDILNPADQNNLASGGDRCFAFNDAGFGQNFFTTTYDPDLMSGWGKRSYNWEFSAGVQHEILPRVSLDVGYFRRWYGNHIVTDNRAVAASDYDYFSVVAPANAALPGGGGYTVSGFANLKPTAFGRAADNLLTFSENYGGESENWNGVDVSVNARLENGLFVQGGTSTGRRARDLCDLWAQVPEAAAADELPYCKQADSWQTQFKGVASYLIPRADVSLAATYQFLPGAEIEANWAANNAAISPSLGRNLSGGAANQTVDLLAPQSTWNERLSQLDLRFSKLVRLGGSRTAISLDIYNVFNSNTVLSQNNTFTGAAWPVPLSILQARFFKIGAQFDF